jgi:hypothetical protein
MPPQNVPPQVELAYQRLAEGLRKVGVEADPLKSTWAELEPGVARLLGGPIDLDRPEHQAVALGISSLLGVRLAQDDGAFWAVNRESPDGWVLGFPDAIIMLSPFGAAMEALSRANLARLDELAREVRTALGRARLAPGAAPARLTPEDYERLFDPAFVQWTVVDEQKLKKAWEEPVSGLLRDVRDGVDRAGPQLPAEVRRQVEAQLVTSLAALDQSKSVLAQVDRAGRLVELVAHLAATVEATPPAPEEFWAGVALPLLFIGKPASFPPLDEEEKEAVKQGVDPLFLYLDVVPYQFPAEEEGLLGAFGDEDVGIPHPALQAVSPLRLFALKLDRLSPAMQGFDPKASREGFDRFLAHVSTETGITVGPGPNHQILDEAFAMVGELKRLWEARTKGQVFLRRLPEAEAAAEGALALVRKAMQGPRIILA